MDSKYEEALERAKIAYKDEDRHLKATLERIFPVLKESEDEIFKELLYNLITSNDYTSSSKEIFSIYGKTKEDCIAWLEKRDEQSIVTDVLIKAGLKPYKDGDKWCVLVGDNIQDGVCGFGDTIDEALFEFLKELSEKQCEQKPADNGKPKFNVGDWIVEPREDKPDYLWHIDRIKDDCYRYDAINAGIKIAYADKECHLWTIQDAKEGDVLNTSSTASHEIFLFKGLDENGNMECLCSYDSEDGFREGEYHFIGKPTSNTHPATKQQRYLLFEKIKEAGYKWDSKNKELKKIEQKPADEPKFKVGDWVMLDRPVLITKVEDMPYNTHQYWTSDGKWFGDATKAKLWTIQDAKDGDVLATDSGRPFIFKGCLDEKHPNSPVSYCGIDSTNYFYNYKGSAWWTDENVYPATKEQRDLLFQKMREAGYEWDAENKKLITIEQNPIRPVCYNSMDDLIADAMIDEINESNIPESSKHNRIFLDKIS